jgi:hypothetical protein
MRNAAMVQTIAKRAMMLDITHVSSIRRGLHIPEGLASAA